MADGDRWVQFPGRGRVLHLVHEESTGWARSEQPDAVIAWCGRISSEPDLVDPPTATDECKMCGRVRGKPVRRS